MNFFSRTTKLNVNFTLYQNYTEITTQFNSPQNF